MNERVLLQSPSVSPDVRRAVKIIAAERNQRVCDVVAHLVSTHDLVREKLSAPGASFVPPAAAPPPVKNPEPTK